jgi:hypothetical protein
MMKKSEVKVGGYYTAKVSGRLTVVRVDAVRERPTYRNPLTQTKVGRASLMYDVTNMTTGRHTTFHSASKFRGPAEAPSGA